MLFSDVRVKVSIKSLLNYAKHDIYSICWVLTARLELGDNFDKTRVPMLSSVSVHADDDIAAAAAAASNCLDTVDIITLYVKYAAASNSPKRAENPASYL